VLGLYVKLGLKTQLTTVTIARQLFSHDGDSVSRDPTDRKSKASSNSEELSMNLQNVL
jgi:hypothetical protein